MSLIEEFLIIRRKNLQLALDQHKFGPWKHMSDFAIRGKLAEVNRMIRKYYHGLDKAIDKETKSYKMAIEKRNNTVIKLTQSKQETKK